MIDFGWDTVLWDFNGTLVDDVEAGIKSVNTLLLRRGLPIVSDIKFYYSVFGFPIRDYYTRLGFDFSKERYEDAAVEWANEYKLNVLSAGLKQDVRCLLDFFRQNGIRQVVVSMSELEMLKKQIGHLGIENYFDDILGLDNVNAHSKITLAEDWRKKNPSSSALLIGDTVHDAETAEAIGAECALVGGGHQSLDTLKARGGELVFKDFKSFYSYLSGS